MGPIRRFWRRHQWLADLDGLVIFITAVCVFFLAVAVARSLGVYWIGLGD
jgi:hypothetical protein